MKISYNNGGETRYIELQVGENWSKFNNTPLKSLFAKLDNGNKIIDQLEIDAIRRQMNCFNTDGKSSNLSKSELKKLNSLNWKKIRNKVMAAENLYTDFMVTAGYPASHESIKKHIYNVVEYNATTVFKTFNEKTNGKKTIIGAVMTNRSLPIEERINYAKYLVRTLATDYKHQGRNADDIAANICKEIDALKNNPNLSDSSRLDSLVNRMLNTQKSGSVSTNTTRTNSSGNYRTTTNTGKSRQTSNNQTRRTSFRSYSTSSDPFAVSNHRTSSTTSTTTRQKSNRSTNTSTYSSNLRTFTPISNDKITNYSSNIPGLNGKIDQNFSQGSVGDCWLLAAIKGIVSTSNGKKLLDDSINILSNGNVQVTLKGVGKTYTYTPSQIQSSQGLSSGDLDVKAIEMATQDYLREHPQSGKNNLNGNFPYVAYQILTGKSGTNLFNFNWNEDYYYFKYGKNLFDNFNKSNHVAVVWHNGNGDYNCSAANGGKQKLIGNHAYTVAGSDRRNVYLVNPYDTSKTISITKKEFKQFFDNINEFDM